MNENNTTSLQAATTTTAPAINTNQALTSQKKEMAIIAQLAKTGEGSMLQAIINTSGDKDFAVKFITCVRQQINKLNVKGKVNPFAVIPVNSIFDCMMKCASRHVLPDGYNAYLIPYAGNNLKCELIIDYKGLINTAINEGIIRKATACEICKNDIVKIEFGEIVQHDIDIFGERGEVVGVEARAELPNGSHLSVFMTKSDVDKIRGTVKTKNVWDAHYIEMMKKTAVRRLFKLIPNTPKVNALMELDNEAYNLPAPDNQYAPRASKTPIKKIVDTQEDDAIDVDAQSEEPF